MKSLMWCVGRNLEAYGEVPDRPAVENSVERERAGLELTVMRDAVAFCMKTSSGLVHEKLLSE